MKSAQGVGGHDVPRLAGRDVDVVETHGDVGDDLQRRAGRVEHLGVDGVGEQTDQRIFAGDAGEQLGAGNRIGLGVQIQLAGRLEPGEH